MCGERAGTGVGGSHVGGRAEHPPLFAAGVWPGKGRAEAEQVGLVQGLSLIQTDAAVLQKGRSGFLAHPVTYEYTKSLYRNAGCFGGVANDARCKMAT